MSKIQKLHSLSASKRWINCTASLLYPTKFEVNKANLKGNLIHDMIQLKLEKIFLKKDNTQKMEDLKNNEYFNPNFPNIKVKWDLDCQDIYTECIKYAIGLYKEYKPTKIILEKKQFVNLYGYIKYGFIDMIMENEDTVIIVDWKTGRGKVEALENSQMFLYSLGVLQDEIKDKNVKQNFIMAICQPPIKNKSAYQYSLEDIKEFYLDLKGAFKEILTGEVVYRPEEHTCVFCPNFKTCEARINAGVLNGKSKK